MIITFPENGELNFGRSFRPSRHPRSGSGLFEGDQVSRLRRYQDHPMYTPLEVYRFLRGPWYRTELFDI